MPNSLHCFVEIPKGSRNKYEWDSELQAIKLDRFLFSSVVYPTDYGFIPETCGEDGDPLDALVCVSEPTFPGCVIAVRAIAVLRMSCTDLFDMVSNAANAPRKCSDATSAETRIRLMLPLSTRASTRSASART